MSTRTAPFLILLAVAAAWIATACERETPGSPAPVDAAPPPGETFAGTYQVRGHTDDPRRGDSRRIEGILVLGEAEEGVYTGSSELETKFPSEGGAIDADVIGNASGRREGNVLRGTAETQIVMGTVPGVQTEFAFVPRQVGPRITSSWTAHFRRDGTLVVRIKNEAAPGEDYAPTETTLFGSRIE